MQHYSDTTSQLTLLDFFVKKEWRVFFAALNSSRPLWMLNTARDRKYSRLQSGRWGGVTRVAPPTPNSIGLYGKSYRCRPEHVHSFVVRFCQIDLAILQKYYVLTLELYAYLNYNLFSNNGHFSQMKSLFTNKLLMTAPPGFFIHISLRIGRPRISTKLGFYTQIMIICCILERDKHVHKWMI